MKKIISILASIYAFLLTSSIAFAQELPKPDFSVWNSEKMKPIRDFANISLGVLIGIAVLYAVGAVAYYGIKLQSSGSDPMKSQEAKNGLKSTLIGVGISLCALFIIGIVLYVLGIVGIKN